MVGKKLTKLQMALEKQKRESKYNLEMMYKNGKISKDYYDKKVKLITIYGGMHHPK